MKLAFICGPYRGASDNEVYGNIQRAREVAVAVWKMGYAVFCPHLNSAFMSGVVDEEAFLEGAKVMLQKCDLVVLTPEWEGSQGAKNEIREAINNGLLVYQFDDGWYDGTGAGLVPKSYADLMEEL